MTGLGNLPVVVDLNNIIEPTFIALQETWLRTFKNARFAQLLRTHHWFIKNTDSQLHEEDMITMKNLSFHGVALGIKTELMDKVTEIEIQQKNIIAIEVSTGNEEINMEHQPSLSTAQRFL